MSFWFSQKRTYNLAMMRESLKLRGKRISVLGAGRTGQAVARFLTGQQAEIFVSDSRQISNILKAEWGPWEIDWEENGHSSRVLEADLIVPSPGIPSDSSILKEAMEREIPILSEIELAYQVAQPERLIAVTGTVGKTTTTHLISEILRCHHYKVMTAGNIGRPFIGCLDQIGPNTVVVLEVSSYQLEHIQEFKPHIGVFTRFAPHHLRRHGTLETYFDLKCRLFKNQIASDVAVVHHEIGLPHSTKAKMISFSATDIEVRDLPLPIHQLENLAAASAAVRQLDERISLRSLDLARILQLPHRIEFVMEWNGTRFYNDSKATSSQATQAALDSFGNEPLLLILGGEESHEDVADLSRQIAKRSVERVLLLGETRERFAHHFRQVGFLRYQSVRDLAHALDVSLQIRPKICLFSPGSPSFDQFRNYEERGRFFKFLLKEKLLKTAITHPSDQEAASL